MKNIILILAAFTLGIGVANAQTKTVRLNNPNGVQFTLIGDPSAPAGPHTLTLPGVGGTLLVSGAPVFTIGNVTTPGTLILNDGDGETGTLQVADLASNRIYTFPDAAGTVTLGTGTANQMTRWTGPNTLGDASLSDDGSGTLSRAGDISINPGALNDVTTDGNLVVENNVTVTSGSLEVTTGDANLLGGVTIGDDGPTDALSIVSETVNFANLPLSTDATDELITIQNGGGDIRRTSISTMLGNNAWRVGGNTITGSNTNLVLGIGTQAANDDGLVIQTDGTDRITIASSGEVTFGASEVTMGDDLNVSGDASVTGKLTALNDAEFGSGASDLVTINSTVSTGGGANKFAGREELNGGAGGQDEFVIANSQVTPTSVIVITLENGTNLAQYTALVSGRNDGNDFTVTLSADIPAGETKFLNYIIINQ